MTLGEVMSRELVTLRESDDLDQADEYLALGHIRHLPVIRGRKLVGLVTHRDLLRQCRRKDATGRPLRAGDVMVREVVTLAPERSARVGIRLMLTNKYGCIPIVQEDGTLVGIVTESDLLRVADQLLEELERHETAAEYV